MNQPLRGHTTRARAHANIALAKYWGKASVQGNLPAVPSVSVTLDALTTTTTVRFGIDVAQDRLSINGQSASEKPLARASRLLDEVRTLAGIHERAEVISTNNFPTASGLASSASAFAALAVGALHAAGVAATPELASDLARRASASAGRSVHGGFVRLPAGVPGDTSLPAHLVAPPSHWDLRVLVAVATEGAKDVGSTEGMGHTMATSPYYPAWVDLGPRLAAVVEAAILARDFEALGVAAEQSALAMHASALAAAPGLLYFEPVTIACLRAVREMRRAGIGAYATIDAGPHVKVLTLPGDVERVRALLEQVPGVIRTISSGVGGAADATTVELS